MSKAAGRIVVVGAGPAGLAAALCLAHEGHPVMLLAPPESGRPPDRRTTALLGASVALLKNLKIWQELEGRSAPLDGIRIVDDRRGLLRAPELLFHARELGLQTFGANVENQDLVAALLAAAQAAPGITRRDGLVTQVHFDADAVVLSLSDGTSLSASLAVAADGRNSLIRKAAGIETDTWSYPQSALAVSFSHSRGHGNVSTELHRRNGPLTSVPLRGRASSLVWVEAPEAAERLAALTDDAFCSLLEDELQGLLGKISAPGKRGVFPLSGLTARRMGTRRVVLIGEAGHVMPPIGAQGLNLGLRDAAALADVLRDVASFDGDPGAEALLQRYHAARTADVLARQISVDVLNRSLLSDFLPLQALRGTGLHLLAHLSPLREAVMRAGMGPSNVPQLMRSH